MKTYDISKFDLDTQFNLGYCAFFRGRPYTEDKPEAWRKGWNQAFSDVMREHSEGNNGK